MQANRKSNVRPTPEPDQGTLYSASSSATGVGAILTITPVTKPPTELSALDQWVVWQLEENPQRPERPRKRPYGPHGAASVTDPEHWTSWKAARARMKRDEFSGVGFVFTADDPYVGIDLDGCRDPDSDRIEAWAVQILRAFRGSAYAEVSPSGTGLKLWVKGTKPPGTRNKWHPFAGNAERAIEVYETNRYFTWTGQMVEGYGTIGAAQSALERLCTSAPPPKSSGTSDRAAAEPRNTSLSDKAVLSRIRKAKPTRYRKLFETGEDDGDDVSELDYELACLCAEQVGNDPARIADLMRQSALVRLKWKRPDYLDRTIAKAIAQAASSADENEGPLHELNRTFAVVQVGRDVVILQEKPNAQPDAEPYTLLRASDFRLLLGNRFIEMPGKKGKPECIPLTTKWLQWEGRRQYDHLVFKPGESVPPDTFNIWRGWGVAPNPAGSCARFLTHLRDIVCDGNAEHYEWLLDWLADMFQRPQQKLGYAVALQGLTGTGKSLVGIALKPLLGRHRVVVDKPRQVTGNFNAHLEGCLLLQAEEAFWAGDKAAEGTLKNIVTGDELPIERKGIDTVNRPNYTRLLITSNEDWVWPTDLGDRRLVIFKVNNRYADTPGPRAARRLKYFACLYAELRAPTFGPHLLHLLLTRVLDEMRLRRAPRTKALEEQAIHSMSPQEAWLRDLLIRGELPHGCVVDAEGRAHVRVRRLYDSYVESLPHGRHRMTQEAFRIFWKQHLPKVSHHVDWQGEAREVFSRRQGRYGQNVQSRRVVLAPLAECRERYSRRGRAAPIKWPGSKQWHVGRE